MDENKIKEQLSRCFIKAIGYHQCCNFSEDENDYGTDLTIKEMTTRTENGGTRYSGTGKAIDVQLKATTENNLVINGGQISYHLPVKNYNDMVSRNIDNAPNPLILILFVLPEQKEDRLSLTTDELIVKKCAYRYKCNEIALSKNQGTITVHIPETNKLQLNTFCSLFTALCPH